MHYLHLLSAFAGEVWAIEPVKLSAIVEFLTFKARGGQLSDEEIAARVDGRTAAATARKEGDVAVMPLVGLISPRADLVAGSSTGGGVTADSFGQRFDAYAQDDTVKAIVMDVHSPGGNSYGLEALAAKIRAARGSKPIIAQVNSQAASGAYWIASQADEIVLTPGAEAGSIGAYTVHEDISEALAKEGVKPTLIKAGEHKAELINFMPLSEAAREATQKRVTEAYRAFVGDVAKGRGVTAGQVEDRMGQGRVFGPKELIERGMADRIATLDETLARLGAARGPRAQQRSRETFAAGETPSLATVEEVLRDAGFPRALALDFVSQGKSAFRRSESGAETIADTASAVRAAAAALAGLRG
ncbi:MAG: S49 family peptidase [Phenylobacterium sp.]|nr:S49 family peptidase [Phenylobacterium sp.]